MNIQKEQKFVILLIANSENYANFGNLDAPKYDIEAVKNMLDNTNDASTEDNIFFSAQNQTYEQL